MLGLTLPLYAAESAEIRPWTSTAGTTVQARLVSSTADLVKLQREDGSILDVPLSKLSPADQEYARAASGRIQALTIKPVPELPVSEATKAEPIEALKSALIAAPLENYGDLFSALRKFKDVRVTPEDFTDSKSYTSLQSMRSYARGKARPLIEKAIAENDAVIIPQTTPTAPAFLYYRDKDGKTKGFKLTAGKWEPDAGMQVANYAINWPREGGVILPSGEVAALTEENKHLKRGWVMNLLVLNFK